MGGMDLLAWICNRASPPWKLSEDKAADVSFIIIIDKAKDIYNVNNIPSTQYLNARAWTRTHVTRVDSS
ncbi:16997_t:CDS:2 [Rhizophagus irregularis]|nr:16997_t:CDS:2 [Rhizophagus irregularis]